MENTLVDIQGMYYNNQSILYIGERDFSFSSSHAARFGVANNIVATSLDSRDDLIVKYGMDAIQHITNLTVRGARVIHSVDARNMAEKKGSNLPLYASGRSRFDVVNYNFPHAGFFGFEDNPQVIRKHTALMQKFFKNAALLLAPGGVVYVAHKCGPIYDSWNLKENANKHGLEFVGSVPFYKSDFPGYMNRRGSGNRAGETFGLGEAAIHKFALRCGVWIQNNDDRGLKIPNVDHFLLQILRSFTEGAPSQTPLLQAIATEVARLEKTKSGKTKRKQKKQRRLNSLKVVVKVVPLLATKKTLAIHQIRSLHPSGAYNLLAKRWSETQSSALEAMEDENEKREQETCGLTEEQDVMEICVSDDIADGALGEEDEEAFSAFVVDTPMSSSIDRREDIHMKTDHVMPPTDLGKVYVHHGYQSCDLNKSVMPGLEIIGVSSEHFEESILLLCKNKLDDMEDMEAVEEMEYEGDGIAEAENVEADHSGKGFINWVIEKILCYGMSNN